MDLRPWLMPVVALRLESLVGARTMDLRPWLMPIVALRLESLVGGADHGLASMANACRRVAT